MTGEKGRKKREREGKKRREIDNPSQLVKSLMKHDMLDGKCMKPIILPPAMGK